jgi:hypothetical protein
VDRGGGPGFGQMLVGVDPPAPPSSALLSPHARASRLPASSSPSNLTLPPGRPDQELGRLLVRSAVVPALERQPPDERVTARLALSF